MDDSERLFVNGSLTFRRVMAYAESGVTDMNSPESGSGRHRRRFGFRHVLRRRWADWVVTVVFVAACLVALLLLLDVIDSTIAKPERGGVVTTH